MPDFQIILRLQMARAHAHALGRPFNPNEIAGIGQLLLWMQSVAAIAQDSGRTAFGAACREVCERLRAASLRGYFSADLCELTADFAAIGEFHVRRPRCNAFAKDLVVLLSDRRWGGAVDAVAQSRLIDQLTAREP